MMPATLSKPSTIPDGARDGEGRTFYVVTSALLIVTGVLAVIAIASMIAVQVLS